MILAVGWSPWAFAPADLEAAGGSPQPTTKKGPSQWEQAAEHYNKGLAHRDKAWEYESKGLAQKKKKGRKKYRKKARKEYEKAIEQQLVATTKKPTFHEAFSSLGYAYRKVREYEKALAAYDRALQLKPDYSEAMQYRAVAHLALGRLEESKQAYEQLFLRDPELAADLLGEMEEWLGSRSETEAADRRDSLAVWMEGKRAVARELGENGDHEKVDW